MSDDFAAGFDVEAFDGGSLLPEGERLALGELVNRVLDKGVVVTGEVTVSIGGVDLLFLGLQVVLASVESLDRMEHVRSIKPGTPKGER